MENHFWRRGQGGRSVFQRRTLQETFRPFVSTTSLTSCNFCRLPASALCYLSNIVHQLADIGFVRMYVPAEHSKVGWALSQVAGAFTQLLQWIERAFTRDKKSDWKAYNQTACQCAHRLAAYTRWSTRGSCVPVVVSVAKSNRSCHAEDTDRLAERQIDTERDAPMPQTDTYIVIHINTHLDTHWLADTDTLQGQTDTGTLHVLSA
eukprot:1220151-Rhodomonas_salina.1